MVSAVFERRHAATTVIGKAVTHVADSCLGGHFSLLTGRVRTALEQSRMNFIHVTYHSESWTSDAWTAKYVQILEFGIPPRSYHVLDCLLRLERPYFSTRLRDSQLLLL
jgi:hypothetical protein